jgi:DNA-binding transcriptional LysR family regulator
MIEQVEALAALAETGTMGAAGTRLRISQSAVSKRISVLEAQLDQRLIERRGRRVRLTSRGERLLERVRPLLAELRSVLSADIAESAAALVVGVSDSILGSYGAELLERGRRRIAGLELEIHAHRSPVAIDRVRAGEYALGLVAGMASPPSDLVAERIGDEPMVIVPSNLEPLRRRGGPLRVITLEAHSETWRSIEEAAKARGIEPVRTVEFAFGAVQMARAGLGHALVPRGVAVALRIPEDRMYPLPRGGIARPVTLVARKSTFARPLVQRFVEALEKQAPRLLTSGAR